MSLPPLPVLDFSFLADPPPVFGSGEVWVLLPDAGAAGADGLAAEAPAATPLPIGAAEQPAAAGEGGAPPADHAEAEMAPDRDLPAEDAFPSLAELDAILAENGGPPPGPDAQTRAEVAAMLGLDPAVAEDPAPFEAAIADYVMPEAEPLPEELLTDPGALGWVWPAAPQDWPLG